jgi:hypothetical protein
MVCQLVGRFQNFKGTIITKLPELHVERARR